MNKYSVSALKFVLFSIILVLCTLILSMSNIELFKPVSNNTEARNSVNIVIDPGHGGEDGGASANGISEKDINLIISTHLYDYFKLCSYTAHLTRDDDRLLYNTGEENRKKYHDLTNRVKFANQFDNAVFISVHQNKFEIPKYKGLQVYYSDNNNLSEHLAKTIQNNTKIHIDNQNKREIKKADSKIRVLDSLNVPAVLVECGFLSNPEEAALLADTDYQKKLAFMIFISTLEFLEENGVLKHEK